MPMDIVPVGRTGSIELTLRLLGYDAPEIVPVESTRIVAEGLGFSVS